MDIQRIRHFAKNPAAFQADLIIPSAHRGPVRFRDVMAEFQRERFSLLNPALVEVANGDKPEIGRHWWEATKGASKDSDLAVCLLWLLAFTTRPLSSQVGAADQDQADELRKAGKDLLRLNPWLSSRLRIHNWKILCEATGSTCEIIAADVAGSHGARPDVLIVNELSHITKEEFAANLADNASKVPRGLMVVATNAGFLGTWQHRWRELARDSSRWCFHAVSRPSPWLDPEEIREAEARNSRSRFLRLWHGVWVSGSGDALDPKDIEAAINQPGPMTGNERDFGFIGGLDLGAKRDHSALVVLGCHGPSGRVRLASCQSWSPPRGGEVDLRAVQKAVLAAHKKYRLVRVGFDPNQALLMAQQLRRSGVRMDEVPFTGRNLNTMASCLIETFRGCNVDLFRHSGLIRDLSRLQIVERNYGYRLESVRDEYGHADLATAFAIGLPFANRRALAGSWGDTPQAHYVRRDVPVSVGRFRRHRRVRF